MLKPFAYGLPRKTDCGTALTICRNWIRRIMLRPYCAASTIFGRAMIQCEENDTAFLSLSHSAVHASHRVIISLRQETSAELNPNIPRLCRLRKQLHLRGREAMLTRALRGYLTMLLFTNIPIAMLQQNAVSSRDAWSCLWPRDLARLRLGYCGLDFAGD